MEHQHNQKDNPLIHDLVTKGFIYTTLHHLSWPQQTLTVDNGLVLRFYHRGMLSITPAKYKGDSATVISVGIHGDETGPIELADKLVTQVLSGEVTISHPCLFIFAHPDATIKKQRFIEQNLNQLFEMSTMQIRGIEGEIAAKIKDVVELFFERSSGKKRWHLDLHCSSRPSQYPVFAIRPATRHQSDATDQELKYFAQHADVQAVLLCHHPSYAFSWYTGEYFQAKSLTIELGQLRALGENDLSVFTSFLSGMHLLLNRNEKVDDVNCMNQDIAVYDVVDEIRKQHSDLAFTARQALINFEPLYLNQEYGMQGGIPMICESGGHALVFANDKVEVGQRAALLVERIR